MRTVLYLLCLSAASLPIAKLTPDTPAAKVTTIASFPNVDAVQVAVVGRGRFIYLATRKGLLLYDPRTKKSKMIAKEFYNVITGSPRGDRLALLRFVENATAADPRSVAWTLPLNPETGEPTGVARRVSMVPANTVRISPDGRQIALLSLGDPAKIVLVPLNGGAERTIAEGRFDAPLRWSPDGKGIYVHRFDDESSQVVRVDAVTGAISEITPKGQSGAPGITPDGKYAIVWNSGSLNMLRYSIFSAGGQKRGDVDVRLPYVGGAIDDAWANDAYHWVWAMRTAPLVVHIADYRSGKSRVVPGVASENLALSPDNSLLYSEEPDPKTAKWVAVMRTADGKNPKVLSDMGRGFNMPLSSQWSPDGRYLLYRTDRGRELTLYDARTASSKVIARTALVGQVHWRSDGKAARYIAYDAFGVHPTVVLRETAIDGKSRILRDLSGDPDENFMELIGDSIIYSRISSTVRFFSGPATKMFDVAPVPAAGAPPSSMHFPFFPSLSPDGRWLARTAIDRKGIDVVALDGSRRRKIPVTLPVVEGVGVRFHPNGREVIVPVRSTADSREGFMAVPLDGGAPRPIVMLPPDESIATYSLSADGSTIVYSTYGLPRVTLVDIDFSPALLH
jgi:Tol biopolymer transport system component